MNKCLLKIFLIAIFILGSLDANIMAYDDQVTHKAITKRAVDYSTLNTYLINALSFQKGIDTTIPSDTGMAVRLWLEEGSKLEDAPLGRASNHFHNPLKPWNESYVNDSALQNIYTWLTGWIPRYSNITWATGLTSPTGVVVLRNNQDRGWDNARTYFYLALTSATSTERETNFAKTFQAVGQVMHLLQDMAVPAHVRNDFKSHLTFGFTPWYWPYNPFEYYVKTNTSIVAAAAGTSPSFGNIRLTDFWDTDGQSSGSAGLAEITNAGYFSDSTIPNNNPTTEHVFPNPQVNTNNSQICIDYAPNSTEQRKYISRSNNGACPPLTTARLADHFATASLVNEESVITQQNISNLKLWLDNNVHNTYAQTLLPRAVGYSAGLLNYFFRGKIGVRSANGGIKVKNLGTETMTSYTDPLAGRVVGTIEVYYDAMINTTTPPTIERRLLRNCPLSTSGCWQTPPNQLAPNQETALIPFVPPADNIAPKRYIVVFRGKLGNEEGAVIGKIALPMMYYMKRVNGIDTIYKMDTDGNSDTVVYENTERDSIGKISVSPDGNTLAFAGGSLIKLLDLASSPTSTPAVLTSGNWPDWSPDGTEIVFERITAQNPSNPFEKDTHIFTINIATHEETQLTASRGTVGSNDNTQPAWSPDGNTIAYSKFAPGGTDCSTWYAIELIDASGNSLGPLTCPPAGEYMQNAGSRPAWSPDGQEIAFVRGEYSFQLYKVNVSTKAVTKLTDTPKNGFDELNPAWSTDGKSIAVSSLRDGYWDIWLVDSNGSGYRANFTDSNPDVDNFPAFEK